MNKFRIGQSAAKENTKDISSWYLSISKRKIMKNKVTLYIATHNITGKKYFGKTEKYFTQEELQKNYHGSGVYWNKHKDKHGDDITMEIYQICSLNKNDEDYVEPIALRFSEENNIVESREWANLKYENGLDGNVKGNKHTKESRQKMKDNTTITDEQKENISKYQSEKITCEHCNKVINRLNYNKYHGDKCGSIFSFSVVSCIKCHREIGINNIKIHTDICFDNIKRKSEYVFCENCEKHISIYGYMQHYKSCKNKTKLNFIKIKKRSCCLNCKLEVSNGNLSRHLLKCLS